MLEALIFALALTALTLGKGLWNAKRHADALAANAPRKPVVTPYVGPLYNAHGREVQPQGRRLI